MSPKDPTRVGYFPCLIGTFEWGKIFKIKFIITLASQTPFEDTNAIFGEKVIWETPLQVLEKLQSRFFGRNSFGL
jgi:hypothetical protein